MEKYTVNVIKYRMEENGKLQKISERIDEIKKKVQETTDRIQNKIAEDKIIRCSYCGNEYKVKEGFCPYCYNVE